MTNNLKGQQKPQYLIDAEDAAMKSWEVCMNAIDRHEKEDTRDSLLVKQTAESNYSKSWQYFKDMQVQWNKERKNV
jgi:hypothetical protein